MAKEEVTGPGDMTTLRRHVEDLTEQVRDLKVQRVSTNWVVKHQRTWTEGELKDRALAAH